MLKGTQGAAATTFATTCHGAGRLQSRTAAKRLFTANGGDASAPPIDEGQFEGMTSGERKKAMARIASQAVLADLAAKGIVVRVASPDDIAEEGPAAYKDIHGIVDTCKFKF